jgi:hypothetical protein
MIKVKAVPKVGLLLAMVLFFSACMGNQNVDATWSMLNETEYSPNTDVVDVNVSQLMNTANEFITNPGFEDDNGWINSNNSAYFETSPWTHGGSRRLVHYTGPMVEVTTEQTITNLVNGYYTLSAWTLTGAESYTEMYTSGFGGDALSNSVPASNGTWTKISIPNIHVTNGQLTVGFKTNSLNDCWVAIDEVKLEANLIISDLDNGVYSLSAEVKTDGVQLISELYAFNDIGDKVKVNVPETNSAWVQVTTPPIAVTKGILHLGMNSKSLEGERMIVNKAELLKINGDVINPGFEGGTRAEVIGWQVNSTNGTESAASQEESLQSRGGAGHLKLSSDSPYQVYVHQIVNGIQNGTYSLKAWVKNNGDFQSLQMKAANYGGSERIHSHTESNSEWQQITIDNLHIQNNQVEIGFIADGNASSWANIDDVQLVAQGNTLVSLEKDNEPIYRNPGKGYVLYGYGPQSISQENQKYANVFYARYQWADIQPTEHDTSFQIIERDIALAKSMGMKYAFRIMNADTVWGREDGYNVPKWVYDAGAKSYIVDSFGHDQYVPEWTDNPIFFEKMEQFVDELGEKYNGHPDIEFIDIGSFGTWGEGHLFNLEIDREGNRHSTPSVIEMMDNYFKPYMDAFPDIPLVTVGGESKFQDVYNWAALQGVSARSDGIPVFSDGSQLTYVHGVGPGIIEMSATYREFIERGQWDAQKIADSYKIGKASFAEISRGGADDYIVSEIDLIRDNANKLGYHFTIDTAQYPATVDPGNDYQLVLNWTNSGYTYLYKPAHVAVALLNDSNQVVQTQWLEDIAPQSFAPDYTTRTDSSFRFNGVDSGKYKLAVGMFLNKSNVKPDYGMGIAGGTDDKWYPMGEIQVSGSNTGSEPTNPSNPAIIPNDTLIESTVNGKNKSFATGTMSTAEGRNVVTVQVDLSKLDGALAEGNDQVLRIHSSKDSDLKVNGLTADSIGKLTGQGASLEISSPLAIYPIPGDRIELNDIANQLSNSSLSDIEVQIEIKRSSEALAKKAGNKAKQEGYELIVPPIEFDLIFSREGQRARADSLNGYARKFIALPEGIDPSNITTGVIVNPDGSVFHVPTIVTKIGNRYYALINDRHSRGSYAVIWNPKEFDDMENHWSRADVRNIAARLNLAGTGNNKFSPDRSVTRSEFAEIVVSGLGLMQLDTPNSAFPDVPSNAWYRNAVALAKQYEIVRGFSDNNFHGTREITREQAFVIIARALNLVKPPVSLLESQIDELLSAYSDAKTVSSWARADIAQLIEAGVVKGSDGGKLHPQTDISRAEIVALIARLLNRGGLIDHLNE